MIRRLLYVSCDGCGRPAGTADDMEETAEAARSSAAALGFVRTPGSPKRDLCSTCNKSSGVTAPYPAGGES